jgi:MYXO-CTERM domain-containing protein
MRGAFLVAFVMGAFAAILGVATTAHGYVRARSGDDQYDLIWADPAITLTVRTGGSLPVSANDLLEATMRATETWNASANDSSVAFSVASSTAAASDPAFDHENTISVRTSDWGQAPYGPTVLALTTVWTEGGAIVDTDTEINGVSPPAPWALLPDDPAMAALEDAVDLQATLTHELGHVLGLAHPCTLGAPPNPPQVDNLGNPVTVCSPSLPASILNATMYPSATPGETGERVLSDDELLALHDLYPAGRAPIVEGASPPPSSGCAVGGPHHGGAGAALGVAAALLARRRRRSTAD